MARQRWRFPLSVRTLDPLCAELLRIVYAKPLPESSSKFWAAVRYAYPNALTDPAEYELALANLAFIYLAGYETTANAITHTLSALALDQDSQTVITEV